MSPMRDLLERRAPSPAEMTLGHIRLGFVRKGYPEQSDTFVITAKKREHLDTLAADFGGSVESYEPQGGGTERWRLVTEQDVIPAVLGVGDIEQFVAQDYVLWGKGYLKRRCEGYGRQAVTFDVDDETGEILESVGPCQCEARGLPFWQRECAFSSRVWIMLPQTGLGFWLVQTGSKKAAQRLAVQAEAIGMIAGERIDWLPIVLSYLPEGTSYFDPNQGKRRATTKRVLSIEIDTRQRGALALLGTAPERALLESVRSTLGNLGHELTGGSDNGVQALSAGEESLPDSEQPTGGTASVGEAGSGEGSGAGGTASEATARDAMRGEPSTSEPPTADPIFKDGDHAGKHVSEAPHEYLRAVIAGKAGSHHYTVVRAAKAWLDHREPELVGEDS